MSGGYRSDPYAQSTYDDPYRAQEAADPYARRSSGSHADPYASHAPYSKRGREYDDYGYDGKRTRYDNNVVARGGGSSADPYARSAQPDPYARSAPPDPYADRYSSRRDDYRAPDPYASSSYRGYDDRRTDDRYASHASHASHYADPYARGSDYGAQRDDRRGSYGGEEYRRRDDYRRDDRGYDRGGYGGGYSDRDYGRSYDRRGGGGGGSSAGYDRRDSYSGGGRDVGYGSSRNYDSGGGGYDRGGSGDRGGGYGRGGGYDDRGGSRGRGRGRGRGGRGRGRGRGGRGGGRGAEREKDPDYVADWTDHHAELDERNFKEPGEDSRQGGPEFDITKAVTLFEAPTEVLPSTVPACDDVSNDVDEESCSLLVGGYPADADVDKVRDFFASAAALRCAPEVKDDGNILVIFKRLRDVPFTVDWFKNPSAAKIDSHSVSIKPLKPSADAAA